MWKKPEIKTSSFSKPNLVELSQNETMNINGGATYWGNCYIKGYACSLARGGWQYGLCAGIGTHTGWVN